MNEVVISDPPITDAIIVGSKEAVLYNFLDRYYGLRFNVITGNLENCKVKINGNAEIISDRELNTICIRIFSALEKEKISREYLNCYLNSKYLKDFNPFFDFIQQNEHLTRSQNLIQELADTIESDTPLENIRKYIKHWGCGMIASIYGSQSPLTLVLAGAKLNTGKTEFFRRLLPKELQEYYAESSLDGGKDDDILMCKKLIIMDDEFGGKSKQDQRHFKAMTSKQVMSIRLPYGKRTQEMRRICSLAGTSNDVSLLNDPYGNRRILPINILGIDHKKYNEIDKSALFMAFVDLYRTGFHWKFTSEDIRQLNDASEDFHAPNPESELISKFFCIPDNENDGEYLTNTIIKDILETKTKQKIWSATKLGLELIKLGFVRSKKGNQKVYYVKEIRPEQYIPPSPKNTPKEQYPF